MDTSYSVIADKEVTDDEVEKRWKTVEKHREDALAKLKEVGDPMRPPRVHLNRQTVRKMLLRRRA